jgi:hypothetical protein
MRALAAAVSLILLGAGAASCGGARPHVTFENSRYPLSMSGVLLAEDGSFVSGASLTKVGRFEAGGRGWGIGWSIIPLGAVDFSEDLNRQVEIAGGEGVIHLSVTAATPALPDMFPGMFFCHWLPVWPGSVDVAASGDIVRRTGIAAPAPAGAPPK